MAATSIDAAPPADTGNLSEILIKLLERSDQPLNASEISKQLTGPYRRSVGELTSILDEMATQQRIHKLPPYRGKDRYWTKDLDEYARERLLALLSESPLMRSEIKDRVKASLRGLSDSRRDNILRELIRSKQIYELPPYLGAKKPRLSTRPADPREYLRSAFTKLAEKLVKEGISKAALFTAARDVIDSEPESVESPSTSESRPAAGVSAAPTATQSLAEMQDLILLRMSEIEPRADQGAMVSISELRRTLDFHHNNAGEFDQAVWALVRRGEVAVHRHGYPASLTEEQRRDLLVDEHGTIYHTISRRLPQ